jgi:hypothetical protein
MNRRKDVLTYEERRKQVKKSDVGKTLRKQAMVSTNEIAVINTK